MQGNGSRTIHRVKAANVCGLREVDLVPPTVGLVIITGPNSSGKTSVLQLARMALGGAKASPRNPIRDGEDLAWEQLDLGDLVVTVTWERKDGGQVIRDLIVERKDGAPLGDTPQSFLDTIAPPDNFDPARWLHLSDKDQFEELRKLFGIDVSDIDGERKELYEQRREYNRDLKKLEARLQGSTCPDGPDTPVSISGLSKELQEALKHNQDCASMKDEWARVNAEVLELEEKIRAFQAHLASAVERKTLVAEAISATKPIDVAPIQSAIANAEQTNRIVQQREAYRVMLAEVNAAQRDTQEVQDRMDVLDGERKAILAHMGNPIEGLSLEDGYVAYQGIPLEQCADNERFRVAIQLALYRRPNFRAIFVRSNELDDDKLEPLAQLAAEYKAQIWLERRGTVENPTFILEDGSVVSHDGAGS